MEITRKRIAKRLLSFTVMLAMLAAMIPLAAMPDSPIAMEVGAFTNQSDFAPGGHTVTVNNITATVIAYNPSAATATVDDISLPARTMRVQLSGTPSVPTRASSPGTTQNNQSGTRGTAGPYNYLIYARANGGKPDEDGVGGATFKANNDTTGYRQGVMPSSELITNLHLLYNTGTAITGAAATVDLTMPAGANQGTIVLYIGMRSHRLNVTSGGSSTTTHIGATQTTTNALTMNGVRMEVKHSGNSQYSGVASYDHIGTLNQGGSITTWFEADSAATGGVDAATGASNTGSNNTAGNNAQDHRSPRSPVKQDVRTFHYYSGDTATGSGSWTMDIGGPGAMILRAEFSGLPSLGGALSANGLSGNATGILNTSGTHSYTVNVPLTGTTLASGNHVVSLDLGALHANGYRIDGEEPTATKATRVFHLNGGTNISTATPRSVRFIVTHTTGNIGTAGLAALTNATTGLKLDFAFHSDVAFSAAAVSGVSATGTARFNNAAELVTVTVNLAGTRDPGGYYTVQLTGTGLPPATTADIRIINTASPMTQTWTISTIDPNIVKYGLGVKIEFIAETTNPTREPWSREKEDLRVAAHAMWSSATEGNVRLTLSSPVTEVANRVPGTYRISLTTNGTDRSEYRFYHSSELRVLPLNHNFSLPFAGVGELQKNNLDVIIDFFPDIITDRNGIVATGKIQANADRTIIDIDLRTPLGAVVEDTGYYTVALIKKDADDKDIFLERTEPRKYTLDGRVADSVTLELLGAMDMEDVLDLKLSIGFDSDTAYIYEIDYYNENLVFGSVVKYGIDIQYVILKPGGYTKFKDAPEKAKWIPTASGVIDLTRHIPKKGTAPAGSAAIVLRYIGSDEAGFMEETGAVVDPVTKVITKFAYKEGDIPRTKKGDEWVDGFTGDFIEIKPRPFDAAMKGKVKDFYNVGRMMFVNETGKTVEVLFGMDRGRKLTVIQRAGSIFINRMRDKDEFPFDADRLPFGTGGILRIAAVDFVSKEMNNEGNLEYLTTKELEDNYKLANFASLPLKFKVGAQPKAPGKPNAATKKMEVNATIAPATGIMKGPSDKMGIVLSSRNDMTTRWGELFGDDDKSAGFGPTTVGNPRTVRNWLNMAANTTLITDPDERGTINVPAAFPKNITVAQFNRILLNSGVPELKLTIGTEEVGSGRADMSRFEVGDFYEFEIRTIDLSVPTKKLISAPSTLRIKISDYEAVKGAGGLPAGPDCLSCGDVAGGCAACFEPCTDEPGGCKGFGLCENPCPDPDPAP